MQSTSTSATLLDIIDVFDVLDVLADRPPVQRVSARGACAFGGAVRDDLEELTDRTATAVQHCEELSRSAPATCSLNMQRDVLHLQARIGGLARQIEDAKQTLERMQQRAMTEPGFRHQLKLPLV